MNKEHIITVTPMGRVDIVSAQENLLKQLQDIVGGHIETVPSCVDGCLLIVNEEGKLRNLAPNKVATTFLADGISDILVGTVAVVTTTDDDICGLPDELMKDFSANTILKGLV